MKPSNITSRSLIIALLSVCNISYLRVLFHSPKLWLTFWYINHKKIKGKECIHVTKELIT